MINMTNIKPHVQKAGIIGIDYKKYIEYLRDRGYNREHMHIDETYTDIVTMSNMAKGAIGTAINIRCPPSYKIVIVGDSQLTEECIADMAGFLTVRLANSGGIEIDPDTRIRILKEKNSQAITTIDTMFYKDISATEYTKTSALNGTKPLDEQYLFGKGIELNGGDHLKIEVILPNIDIDANNIRISLGIDLWEQE